MKKTIEKNTTVAAGKVSLGNKIAFACGDIFGGGSFNVINFLFVEFLTLVVGLPMTSLAVVLLLTKIWDGVIDPFIGKITDGKTPGRLGKRRFFMLVAAPFVLVGFVALFFPWNIIPSIADNVPVKMFLVIVSYMFYATAQSLVLIPYYSHASEMTDDYTERNKVNALRLCFSLASSLLCVVLDCSDKWGKYKDTIALFDYCFERYSMVSVKTDEIAAYDIPVGSLTNTAGMVHIAATGDLDVLVPKGTAVESIALKYNIPSRYKVGERIDPQVELWCGGELVGTFPMEYTVETYAPVEDVPKDDVTTAGSGSVVLTVLKWIGIVLGALIVILFVLRAYFMARRRRRAKQRRRAPRRRRN